jgi:hypothetical protein
MLKYREQRIRMVYEDLTTALPNLEKEFVSFPNISMVANLVCFMFIPCVVTYIISLSFNKVPPLQKQMTPTVSRNGSHHGGRSLKVPMPLGFLPIKHIEDSTIQ